MNRIFEYLNFYRQAQSFKKIHSPVAFSFANEVLENKDQYYAFDDIETLRKNYLSDDTILHFKDPGAGSQMFRKNGRKVKELAKASLSTSRQCKEIFHIVRWSGAKNILELGTSLGISALYLSSWSNASNVVTMEGARPIANIARQSIKHLDKGNIHLVAGNFQDLLLPVCQKMGKIDLAFIDGHHEKEPCLRYYGQIKEYCHENSIIIIDDIYWSNSMKSAWQSLLQDNDVRLSIDLFHYGVLFYSQKLKEKKHLKLIRHSLKPWQFLL